MTKRKIKANLVKAYDQQAEQRNKGGIQDWKIKERAHFLSLLQRESKHTLLEIGTGHGRDSQYFREQGLKVIGIDLTPTMVRLCRQKGITALLMDMVEQGFKKNSFDAVYALNCFLHLPKSEFPFALENVRFVLQPTGSFYLGMYGGVDFEGIWDEDPYTPKRFFSFYTDGVLKENLSKTFDIKYFRHIPLGEDRKPFQSFVLRKRLDKKKERIFSSARCFTLIENRVLSDSTQCFADPIQKPLLLRLDRRSQ